MTALTLPYPESPGLTFATALYRRVKDTVDEARRVLTFLSDRVREAYNDPAYVAGVCATYAVRAGADPVWASEEMLTWMVASILKPSPSTWDEVGWMTREHRIEVAVAALRAHALHRPRPGYACTFAGTAVHHRVTVNTFTLRATR
jgi:hypothetical protein